MEWQLRMFRKTLKKKMRLAALRKMIGGIDENEECLFVTCGDNNGAMNHHLKEMGGSWTWADLESRNIPEMERLLKEPVHHVSREALPHGTASFDLVIAVDVHEHLPDPGPFTGELSRITRPGGRVIVTVPDGDESRPAVRIKNLVGMTKEKYGHVREGLGVSELSRLMGDNGITPIFRDSFSGFFTEMLELSINFLYVNILAGKKTAEGTIAPATRSQMKSVEKSYRVYSLIYPLFFLISRIDCLFPDGSGHVVMVGGRKE